jgi:hypothetical protein
VDPDTNNSDMTYLAQNLVDLGKNSRACALVRRYGVDYMVVAPDDYLPKQRLPGPYSGVGDPGKASGFQLIRAAGPLKLYKITICQPSSHSAAPIDTASGGGG